MSPRSSAAAGRSPADAEVLAETEVLARGALEEARRSVLGLHPTPLQHHALRDALAPELAGLAKRAGLATQFYVQGAERPLAAALGPRELFDSLPTRITTRSRAPATAWRSAAGGS
jgi:signal transduction histidine kinase